MWCGEKVKGNTYLLAEGEGLMAWGERGHGNGREVRTLELTMVKFQSRRKFSSWSRNAAGDEIATMQLRHRTHITLSSITQTSRRLSAAPNNLRSIPCKLQHPPPQPSQRSRQWLQSAEPNIYPHLPFRSSNHQFSVLCREEIQVRNTWHGHGHGSWVM